MKQAATNLPLSPDESYEASRHLGRSLFAALQLAREQEMRRHAAARGEIGDGNVLKIPIPQRLMPNKVASTRSHSVVEQPDGELSYKSTKHFPTQTAARDVPTNLGALAGGVGAAALGGAVLPAALLGGVAGAIYDGKSARSGLKFQKTVKHLDGTKEHLYDVENNPGAAALLKRHLGKLLGTAGGIAALRALPPSKLNLLLPLAGLSVGQSLDKWHKNHDVAAAGRSPEQQADMLTDVEFHNRMHSKKADDAGMLDPGMFGRAFSKINSHPVRMLFGGQEGFREAKKDHYYEQRQQIQEELEHAQREYIDTLSRIKQGSDTETPAVDAFCNGVAHMALFGKTASFKDVEISDGSVHRLLSEALHKATKPLRPVVDPLATGLMGTGIGTAYATFLLRKQMREEPDKYMEEHSPTRVELQPYV